MKLVETHYIKHNHPSFDEIDAVCYHAKNIYNCLIYYTRQEYFKTNNKYFNEKQLYDKLKILEEYKQLPRKVGNAVIYQVKNVWKSYTNLLQLYYAGGLEHKPNIPKYKPSNGRSIAEYELCAISRKGLKDNKIQLSGTEISIPLINHNEKILAARIIPIHKHLYKIEIIYEKKELEPSVSEKKCAIDLGINNLATLVFNDNSRPVIIKGTKLKSINQYYNKLLAKYKSKLPKGQYTSNRILAITNKRNRKIGHLMHEASRFITNECENRGVGVVVVGYNEGWKQKVNIGKKNNQKFVCIPHRTLLDQITYKTDLIGIQTISHEESYTSKCSFLDGEPIQKHEVYMGRRETSGVVCAAGKKDNKRGRKRRV